MATCLVEVEVPLVVVGDVELNGRPIVEEGEEYHHLTLPNMAELGCLHTHP